MINILTLGRYSSVSKEYLKTYIIIYIFQQNSTNIHKLFKIPNIEVLQKSNIYRCIYANTGNIKILSLGAGEFVERADKRNDILMNNSMLYPIKTIAEFV